MLTINNKFDLGQEVYLLELKPIKYDCPVCNGKGLFNHNGYDVKCPKCNGTGKIEDRNTRLYVVKDGKFTVTGVRTNTRDTFCISEEWDGIVTSIRYNTTGGKRAENRVYATLDEAVKACEQLNRES